MADVVGILHPGAMGASLGAALAGRGHRVVWCSAGRSEATRDRAARDGLVDVEGLDRVLVQSDVVVSICPPHAALAVATEVAALDYEGVYVDANAVAPATARRVGEVVEERGARFVDGGVVGPPARQAGTTRLFLAGPDAEAVAARFDGSPVDAVVLDAPPGAASALKAAYAAWTKGTSALLLAVRAFAAAEGVDGPLLEEWRRSQPGLGERSEAGAGVAVKAWRFAGEMDEVGAAFGGDGLPEGFHRAAAEVYRRLERFAREAPEIEAVVRALLEG